MRLALRALFPSLSLPEWNEFHRAFPDEFGLYERNARTGTRRDGAGWERKTALLVIQSVFTVA